MVNPILVAKLAPIAEAQRQGQIRRLQSLVWLGAALVGVVLLLCRFYGGFAVSWGHFLILVGAALGGGFLVRVGVRRREVDLREIARRIEREHPDLHALLLTAMDVAPDGRTGDFGYLQKRVIREALAKNLRSPWDQRGRERLLFSQFFYGVSVVVFVAVVLAGFGVGGESGQLAVGRDVEVLPGNVVIERGSSVVVTATFGKRVPNEATLVVFSAEGGVRRLPLARNLEDPVFGNSLGAVDAETLYYVEYGEERTEQYRLGVFEYPALVRADASLDYPGYPGLLDRVIKDTRRITAVEGTGLEYRLLLNKAVVAGSLVGRKGGEVDLKADSEQANVYWARFDSLAESDTYELRLEDLEGRENKAVVDFVIQVRENRKAVLKLGFPAGDQRFSAVEEVEFEGEVWDDYGMGAYGFGYAIGDGEAVLVKHGEGAGAKERRAVDQLLELEDFALRPQSLVTYYLWADDVGPDGEVRRNYSDMYFAEIRPFEEVFREDQSGGGSPERQGEGQGNSPAIDLLRLQKEIINAAWNIQRRESERRPSDLFAEDVNVVRESQGVAITQLEQVRQEVEGEKEQEMLQQAKDAMEQTIEHLEDSVDAKSPTKLSSAVGTARTAYHYLLQIQPEEFRVSQGQGGGGGGNRSQQQLNQLEMTNEADGYETQSQAASQQDAQQNEQLQIFNRLKELARRQEDLNRRLQELQTALDAADEEEKEDIEHQLKRLRDQQRQMLEDMDELRQRVANQNTPESAEALSQLDQVRSESQRAGELLEDRQVSQALASGARTQQSLEELRDEYRRENSGQFSQAMQDMRERARQLSQRQDEIRDGLSAAAQENRQSLAESEEAAQVMENVERQKEEIQSLMEEVRSVSEDSESAEPLLSRQLHETYRAVDPEEVNMQLEYTSQLARLSLIDKAQEFEAQAHEAVDELQDRIDRAAESVLGDGVESLRRARLVLDELLEEVGNEIAGNLPGQETTPASDSPEGRQPGRRNSENLTTRGANGEPSVENPEQNPSPQLRQNGNSNPQNRENSEGRSEAGEESGEPAGQNREPSQSSDLLTAWNIGNENNPNGGNRGPLTGQNFTQFSDRLREVEEMIDLQNLQNEVASVRDRARAIRAEFKRNGKEPQWEFVQLQIEKPLTEIQQQIGEELARRLSKEAVVPIDRDPVPQQYSELVRRYYETLGGSDEE